MDSSSAALKKRFQEMGRPVELFQRWKLIRVSSYKQGYYCAKCDNIYPFAQFYISHCMRCQNFIYKGSSHQMILNDKICEGIEAIRYIYQQKCDDKHLSFFCGCGRKWSNQNGYLFHMILAHNSEIPPQSSHIIIRCFKNKYFNIYISNKYLWPHNEKIYSCQCDDQRVCMRDLVLHVMRVHSGITDLFNYSTAPSHTLSPANQRQLEMLQNIVDLYSSPLMQAGFVCGWCKWQYSRAGSYRLHMVEKHKGDIGLSSSHVVLITQYRSCLYLPLKMEWHQQAQYFCPCNFLDEMTLEALIKHIFQQHKDQQTEKMASRKQNQQVTKEKKVGGPNDHRSQRFRCSMCVTEEFCQRQYLKHMKKVHHGSIPANSSHIILQYTANHGITTQNLYFCPSIEWSGTYPCYYCPCLLPQKDFTMPKLMQHILQEHHGISPVYNPGNYEKKGAIKKEEAVQNAASIPQRQQGLEDKRVQDEQRVGPDNEKNQSSSASVRNDG